MPNIRPIEGQVLFDEILDLDIPLEEAWKQAIAFDRGSDLESPQTRYHQLGNLVLRQYILPDRLEEMGWVKPTKEVFDKTGQHLQKLHEFGMRVISHALEPIEFIEPIPDTSTEDVIVGYGATPYIPHLVMLNDKHAYLPGKSVTPTIINNHILQPVFKYLNWCQETSEPYFLGDIYTARQYSIHAADGRLQLHDPDPYMKPVGPGPDILDHYTHLADALFEVRYM